MRDGAGRHRQRRENGRRIINIEGSPDGDEDGLNDLEEAAAGTQPDDPDSDDDGMLDGFEVDQGFAPLDGSDGPLDADEDGLDNAGENDEGTDPHDADSDDDGLSDGDEVNTHESDPMKTDTDDDGVDDGTEVTNGMSPVSEECARSVRTLDQLSSPYRTAARRTSCQRRGRCR